MSGFVLMHREALEHPLFAKDAQRLGAWLWMVGRACWKPAKFNVQGKTIEIGRGQFCCTVRELGDAWGMSKSAVDRFLTRLRTETMIETDSGTGRLVITICNYAKYQDLGSEAGTAAGTASGTAAGQQRDTKEQGNKGTREQEPSGSYSQGAGASGLDLGEFEPSPAQAFAPEDLCRMWNRAADEMGLPKVREMTEARRKRAATMIRKYGRDGFVEAISAIERSAFLRGEGDQEFKADLDFLLQQKSFTRLIEGFYDRIGRTKSRARYEPDGAMAYLQDQLGLAGDHQPPRSTGRRDDGPASGGDLMPYAGD